MSYINHCEVEVRSQGGAWEHIGNYYPKYKWRITRPWWLLWRARPAITDHKPAAIAKSYVAGTLARLHRRDHCDAFRVWEWRRGLFGRLTRCIAWIVP